MAISAPAPKTENQEEDKEKVTALAAAKTVSQRAHTPSHLLAGTTTFPCS